MKKIEFKLVETEQDQFPQYVQAALDGVAELAYLIETEEEESVVDALCLAQDYMLSELCVRCDEYQIGLDQSKFLFGSEVVSIKEILNIYRFMDILEAVYGRDL